MIIYIQQFIVFYFSENNFQRCLERNRVVQNISPKRRDIASKIDLTELLTRQTNDRHLKLEETTRHGPGAIFSPSPRRLTLFFFFSLNNAENKEKDKCGSFGIKIRLEPDKYVFAIVRAIFAAR